jgi:hypothetical protein
MSLVGLINIPTLVSALNSTLHAHWLSWSGGEEQGQTRHEGPVFEKALGAQAWPKNGGPRLLTHAHRLVFAWCVHMTQVVHGAHAATTKNHKAPVNELNHVNK